MKSFFIAIATAVLFFMSDGCTLVKVYIREEPQPLTERRVSGEGSDKVLVLDISGMITSMDGRPQLTEPRPVGMLARVKEELDRARLDKSVKAVVLRINSPGGTVTASDTLYNEINRFKKETGARVVAHIMDVGASGAYYAALAADRIIAQPTSITGSIGVVMFRIDATGLMQKIGIEATEIASGERKGMGSPFRKLLPEEERIFKGLIDSMYNRFVSIVSENRGIPLDKVKRFADGRIYTSDEARALGLIDRIGYLEDAIEAAKRMAGLDNASVVVYFRPGEFRPNVYAMSFINIDAGLFEPGVQFMYLWAP